MEQKIKKLEQKLKTERERNRIINGEDESQSKREKKLEKLRSELGEKRGAGHFFGNDKVIFREEMKQKEIEEILRLLKLREKKINLKENEFQLYLFPCRPQAAVMLTSKLSALILRKTAD